MKFLKQVVLPILLVVILIGGVTFISQYGGTRKKPPVARVELEEDPLEFDRQLTDGNVTTVKWDEQVPERFADFEVHTKNHYDFRFDARGNAPVDLSLKRKSCNCARVHVTLLTPEEANRLNGCVPAAVVLSGTGGFPGLLGSVPAIRGWLQFLDAPDRWQELDDRTGMPMPIPAAPTTGLVRLSWEGKQVNREGLVADLWVRQKPKGQVLRRLRVPLNFVPAIQVAEEPVTVPDLTAGGQGRKVEFNCWSATRPSFSLEAREESGSPCFVCEVKPLGAAEREKLAIENRDRGVRDWQSPPQSEEERVRLANELTSRVLSGYRVTVTVHERRGEQQLDLGPYRRRIHLRAGPADKETAVVMLNGMVRGEVAFVNPEDKDRIDLGVFPASRGTSKTVTLRTEDEGRPLEVVSRTPAALTVKIVPVGGRRWDLTVEMPANRPSGRLPEDSAVIVRAGARRMRIPVVGQAKQ